MKKLSNLPLKWSVTLLFAGTLLLTLVLIILANASSKPAAVVAERVAVSELEQYLDIDVTVNPDGTYQLTTEQLTEFLAAQLEQQIDSTGQEVYLETLREQTEQATYDGNFSQALITPQDGGQLQVGNLTVNFASGSYSEPLIVTYTNYLPKLELEEEQGAIFDLTARTLAGQEVSEFAQPVTISFTAPHTSEFTASYFDEISEDWIAVDYQINNQQISLSTDHFTLYALTDPVVVRQAGAMLRRLNLFDHSGCPMLVDDSSPSPCFEPYAGVWYPKQIGYNGTSLMTTKANASFALWTPNQEALSGALEVQITVPDVSVPGFTTMAHNAYYYILHADGMERLVVNLEEAAGDVVSLGTYNFDGQGALGQTTMCWDTQGVLCSGHSQVQVADAAAFGVSGGGDDGGGVVLDFTKPEINDVVTNADQNTFYIQATITDDMTGVAAAYLYFNGQQVQLNQSGDVFSGQIAYQPGIELDYYILAYDGAGNEAIWHPTRGYISRGMAEGLGLPSRLYKPKVTVGNSLAPIQPGSDPCHPSCSADPVNNVTGNFFDQIELVSIPGRPEIDLTITHNSQGGLASIFGDNWSHNFGYKVSEMQNADFTGAFVYYPDGRVERYVGEDLQPEPGNLDKLEKTGQGFILRSFDQLRMTQGNTIVFDNFGDPKRIEDLNGNGLNLEFSEQNEFTHTSKLTKVTADGGRSITLDYAGENVSQINLPENLNIKLRYSADNDLVGVTDPNGGETTFEYQGHALTKKISPLGHAYLANSYDNQKRVTQQVAGTSYKLDYAYLPEQTQITDAYGYMAVYKHNGQQIIELVDEENYSKHYAYDDAGQIISETDHSGHSYQYEYDSDGNQTKITDPTGAEITRTYNEQGKITTEVREGGQQYQYSYDNSGNLTRITDPYGNYKSLSYDNHGQLVAETDYRGNTTHYSYTPQGDLIKVTDAVGGSNTFAYDQLGRLVKHTKSNGASYDYQYDAAGNAIQITGPLGYAEHFTYDANHRLTSRTDAAGHVTSYTYDNSENLVEVTDAAGNETSWQYGQMNELQLQINALGTVTTYNYNRTYDLTSRTDASGTTTAATTSYNNNAVRIPQAITDPEGRKTVYEFDPQYRITKLVEDATGLAATTQFEYSATGQVTNLVDALGNETIYEYDLLDRVISETDALGNTTNYTYDNDGNLISKIDALGQETHYQYDQLSRLASITDPAGGDTHFAYDGNSNLIETVNANGVITKYDYDQLDRMVRKTEAFVDGLSAVLLSIINPASEFLTGNTIYDYTQEGVSTNLVTSYEYDPVGNVTRITNPRGHTTEFAYDSLGRLIATTDAASNTTSYQYDALGNLLAITDRNGNTTTNKYDELSRLIKQINAAQHQTNYSYDRMGNLIQLTDARGSKTSYSYNGLDLITQQTDALGHTTSYNYNLVGNVTQLTDANGHVTSYQYDSVYNLTAEINPEGHTTAYTYDAVYNLATATDAGGNATDYEYDELSRLIAITDALGGVTSYSYDHLDNVTSKQDANGHTDNYSYDPLNRTVKATDAAGNTTTYRYDANGNQVWVTDAEGNGTVMLFDELNRQVQLINAEGQSTYFAYDNEHNVISQTAADGVVTAYDYDAIYQLTSVNLNEVEGGAEDSETNVRTSYNYDATGNLVQIIDPQDNITSFEYDALNRLLKEVNAIGGTWTYNYDPVGNQTSRTDANGQQTAYTYYPDNMLKSINYPNSQIPTPNTQYEYDPNNNRTAMTDGLGTSSWQYDALGRIVSATDSLGRVVGYQYDQVGNTTAITYPDVTQSGVEVGQQVNYAYQANDWLAQVTDPQGITTDYRYDKVGNVLQSVTEIDTPNVATYSYDHVYRITNITNEAAGKTNSSFHYTYDSVGQRTQVDQTYAWRQPSSVTESYTYDPIRRLTNSTTSEGITNSYSYDRNSNRVSWVSNDSNRTPKPFDETDLVYEYNSINSLMRVIERKDVNSGGNGDVKGKSNSSLPPVTPESPSATAPGQQKKIVTETVTEQVPVPQIANSFRSEVNNFLKYLETQHGQHISESAYNSLHSQVTALIAAADEGFLIQSAAQQMYDQLVSSIDSYVASGEIGNQGIGNSLKVKLSPVADAISALPVAVQYDTVTKEVEVEVTVEVPTAGQVAGVTAQVPTAVAANTPQTEKVREILFAYDQNGNRISKEIIDPFTGPNNQLTSYAYNPENRLTSVTNYQRSQDQGNWITRGNTTMQYDGMQRRLVKTFDPKLDSNASGSGKKTVEYTFDGLDPIAEYSTLNDHVTAYYYGAGNQMISAQNFTPDGQTEKDFYHHDALDSIVGITSGGSQHNYRYTDFGELEHQANDKQSSSAFIDPHSHYTYTGVEFDEATELYEFYSRSFDPQFGVWLQQDHYRGELSDPQSLLRYMYVGQSPVNYKDYYGYDYQGDLKLLAGTFIGVGDWAATNIVGSLEIPLKYNPANFVQSFSDTAVHDLINNGLPQTSEEALSRSLMSALHTSPIGQEYITKGLGYTSSNELWWESRDYLLHSVFCVGDESYFQDDVMIWEKLLPGLSNVQNIHSISTTQMEKGYLLGRSIGDVVDIASIIAGLYEAAPKLTSFAKNFGDEGAELAAKAASAVGDDVIYVTPNGTAVPGSVFKSNPSVTATTWDAIGTGEIKSIQLGNDIYQFSDHAYSEMNAGGLTPNNVINTVKNGESIRYSNRLGPVTAYRTPDGTFVAIGDNRLIITVIENTSPNYLNNILKNPLYKPL